MKKTVVFVAVMMFCGFGTVNATGNPPTRSKLHSFMDPNVEGYTFYEMQSLIKLRRNLVTEDEYFIRVAEVMNENMLLFPDVKLLDNGKGFRISMYGESYDLAYFTKENARFFWKNKIKFSEASNGTIETEYDAVDNSHNFTTRARMEKFGERFVIFDLEDWDFFPEELRSLGTQMHRMYLASNFCGQPPHEKIRYEAFKPVVAPKERIDLSKPAPVKYEDRQVVNNYITNNYSDDRHPRYLGLKIGFVAIGFVGVGTLAYFIIKNNLPKPQAPYVPPVPRQEEPPYGGNQTQPNEPAAPANYGGGQTQPQE